jgi:hypothetical protein
MFLLVPDDDETVLDELLPILGADKCSTRTEDWSITVLVLRQEARGGLDTKKWSLFKVPPPDEDRLVMVSEAIDEQLREEGQAALDLETKMVTVTEVQAIATGLGLSMRLVAVLKPKGGQLPPLESASDRELLSAIANLGGTASTGQIAIHLGKPKVPIRKRLQVLVRFGRLKQTGRLGGVRYSIPETT